MIDHWELASKRTDVRRNMSSGIDYLQTFLKNLVMDKHMRHYDDSHEFL